MEQEKKIAVVGAGAIGGLVASRLVRGGVQVSVLDRGAQFDAIRANGLTIIEEGATSHVCVHASDCPAELGVQDIVFVCLKGQALVAAAASLKPLVGPGTHIVSVMNGVPWWFLEGFSDRRSLAAVDPHGAVLDALPAAQTSGCVVHLSSAMAGPGVIRKGTGNHLIIGAALPSGIEKANALAGLLTRAGFDAQFAANIREELWMKLWGNMTMNPISALTRSTADVILDDPLTERIVVSVMEEARAIGAKFGISLSMTPAERNAITREFGAFKTSMLQDLEGGRELEVDALLGAPLELAGIAGVAAPWLGALYGLTRQLNGNLTAARAVNSNTSLPRDSA